MKPRSPGNKGAPRRDSKSEARARNRAKQATERAKLRKRLTEMLNRAMRRHESIQHRALNTWYVYHAMPEDQYRQLVAWHKEWEEYLRNERSKLYGKTSGTHGVPRS